MAVQVHKLQPNYKILFYITNLKSMVKKMVGDKENDIIQASVLLACLAVQNGAKILRVHDVKETFNAISVLQAV